MQEAKNTQRAIVRIGYDGSVHKLFQGPNAQERFENEVRVLKYLEFRKCGFVPRLLESNPQTLEIVTTNCGARVQHLSDERMRELFEELETFGVRHEDPFLRNITYRASDGRFCLIDFEFASIIGPVQDFPEGASGDAQAETPTQLKWSALTHVGRFRKNNEDAFLAARLDERGIQYLGKVGDSTTDRADFIFAVSDGMGGERSGEFASKICIEKITLLLPKKYSLKPERFLAYHTEILNELFTSIHQEMTKLGRTDPHCRNMGATLSLVWFKHGRMYFGHIGDSRIYHLSSSGEMTQITEDHTHVGWLRRDNKINEREARTHPRKNVLSQALGAGHQFLSPHIGFREYALGDRILLCTDGVTDGLWDRGIQEVIQEHPPANTQSTIAERIVHRAVQESGRDNATAVVVQVD